MSAYVWGVLTLPIGLAVLFALWVVAKAGYLALGLLGKVGIARFGNPASEFRYRAGAVVASSGRILMLNKGTTGVVFFTGITHKRLGWGSVNAYESGLRNTEKRLDDLGKAS